ncbi:hypothetical protein [Papillibacter cinnamivorans]|uniref:Uncharacterized protein n=1 Tax=Papillibacter cinnamivorans DSM 12816 TaxID=1122930 RepID=A0A1W1ZHT3_9FIRM|nr:hypothetical protein [Papillibacter cinnamivorans]SMC47926.1 hypothetical protein SAMN02745168_1111 [Papillibacter cinnamivorans DSM 12816]
MNELVRIRDEIIAISHPEKIILYGEKKVVSSGKTGEAKFCLVLDTADKQAVEKKLYLKIDSEVSFDIIVYTPDEWECLLEDPQSYASRILERGTILYDASEARPSEAGKED